MQDTKLHPLKLVRTAALGAALCAAVGLACFFGGRRSARDSAETTRLDAVVLETRLTEIRELATVNYHYTNMAQFENGSDFYGVRIPFTTKRFILTYDGEIKAGIDLNRAGVEVRDTEVLVTLPGAQILSHEIDENSVEIFDEKTSIFNPFTVEDFTSFQAGQKSVMEQKALDGGLLDEAAARAGDSVALLLSPLVPDGYTLTVSAGASA